MSIHKIKKALKELEHHILSTIDWQNLLYLEGQESVYKKLLALKARLAPTDRIRELEVSKRYRDLLKAPKAQNLDQWLLDWERIYAEAVKLSLPHIQNHRCLYDFLNALRAVDMPFIAGREAITEDKIQQNGSPPTLKELLESYRNHLRTTRALNIMDATHSAFAKLQGEGPDATAHTHGDGDGEKKTCLCGEAHAFRKCPYIIPKVRPPGWMPDKEIQKQVNEKLIRPKMKS